MLLFIQELLQYMKVRKKFWLFPIMLMMLILGTLMVLAEGSIATPFIYTLF